MQILCLLILSFFVTLLSLLFGVLVGVKFYDLFESRIAALVGPIAALALGLAFGIREIGLWAGLLAGAIGAAGSAIALFRN